MDRTSRWIARAGLAAPLLLGSGCGMVEINDKVAASALGCPSVSGHRLRFGRSGNPEVDGPSIDLPLVEEVRRFGIKLVDVAAVPEDLRPRHAAAGGVLVARLLDVSPLALAGLEPMDLVLSVNGKPVETAAEVLAALEGTADEATIRLEVRKPEVHSFPGARLGSAADQLAARTLPEETVTIEATPHGPLDDGHGLSLLVFWTYSTGHGSGWSFSPLEQILARSDYTRASEDAGVTTVNRVVEWGGPLGLYHYKRTEVSRRGRPVGESSETTIFWFIPVYSHAEGEEKNP